MAEIVVDLGKGGPDGKRLLIGPGGGVEPLEARQGKAEVMMCVGRFSVDLGCPPEKRLCRLEFSPLQANDTETKQCFEVMLVRRKDGLIELLGFPHTAPVGQSGRLLKGNHRICKHWLEEGR